MTYRVVQVTGDGTESAQVVATNAFQPGAQVNRKKMFIMLNRKYWQCQNWVPSENNPWKESNVSLISYLHFPGSDTESIQQWWQPHPWQPGHRNEVHLLPHHCGYKRGPSDITRRCIRYQCCAGSGHSCWRWELPPMVCIVCSIIQAILKGMPRSRGERSFDLQNSITL